MISVRVCACVCAWQMAGVSPLVLCHVGKISRYDTTSSWVRHAAPDPSLLSDSRSDSCVPLTVLPTGCVQVSPRYFQKCFSTFLSFLSVWIGMEIKTQRFQCGVQHLLLINWQLCTQPAFFPGSEWALRGWLRVLVSMICLRTVRGWATEAKI